MENLKDKLNEVKDAHAAEVVVQIEADVRSKTINESMFILGRVKQNESIGRAISSGLASQSIRALAQFQREKRHEDFGFERFAEFLDESPYSPMTKKQFYERSKLLDSEGDELFDLLTEMGVSMATRKLLTNGSTKVVIDGDRVIVGSETADLTDSPTIKGLIKDLAEEIRSQTAEIEKQKKKVDGLKEQISHGTTENEQLRRNLDALHEKTPFERALSRAVAAFIRLTDEVKSLGDKERELRSGDDLKLFAGQWFRLRDAYGSSMALADAGDLETGDEFLDRALEEIAQDDDWGEE